MSNSEENSIIKDIIGVIFDFNGTMFFDSDFHIRAWASYVEELTGAYPSKVEIEGYISGKSGREILEHFLGYGISDGILEQMTEEKEGIYRSLCIAKKDSLELANGLTDFLDYLLEYNIPRTIATTASLSNVMFYFETFDLYRWFDPDKLVCSGINNIRPKPFPDMYLMASRLIDKAPERCLVFEDSITGITSAVKAGIKHIVVVKGDNMHINDIEPPSLEPPLNKFAGIERIITDFTELK